MYAQSTITASTIKRADGFAVIGHVAHHGQIYSSGAGLVSDDRLICYPAADSTIGTWAGPIAGAKIIRRTTYRQWNPFSRRHEPRTCYRIRLADGREYSGRGSGDGMILTARRIGRKATK